MLPINQSDISELKKLADRNVANGDWGDETKVPGLPGETVIPVSPEARQAKRGVRGVLAKVGAQRLPKKSR